MGGQRGVGVREWRVCVYRFDFLSVGDGPLGRVGRCWGEWGKGRGVIAPFRMVLPLPSNLTTAHRHARKSNTLPHTPLRTTSLPLPFFPLHPPSHPLAPRRRLGFEPPRPPHPRSLRRRCRRRRRSQTHRLGAVTTNRHGALCMGADRANRGRLDRDDDDRFCLFIVWGARVGRPWRRR